MPVKTKVAKKKYYTVDQNKHTVVVDTTVIPTKDDEAALAIYVKMGYAMRMKSQARVKSIKARADVLDAAAIREALKADKDGLAKFEDILSGKDPDYKKGFFAAKKWYKSR